MEHEFRADAQVFEPIEPFSGQYSSANYLVPGGIVTFDGVQWRRYRWDMEVEIDRYSAALLVYPTAVEPVLIVTGGLDKRLLASERCVAIWASENFGFKYSNLECVNSLQIPRFLHAVVQLKDKIYAIGGQQRLNSGDQIYLKSCESLQISSQFHHISTWRMIPALNRPRSTITATVVNERIYVIGGFSGEMRLSFDMEVLESDQNWRLIVVKHCVLAGVSVVRKDRELWIMGGSDGVMEYDTVLGYHVDREEMRVVSVTLEAPVSLAVPFHIPPHLILTTSHPQSIPPSAFPPNLSLSSLSSFPLAY